jgi:hypothetical protein
MAQVIHDYVVNALLQADVEKVALDTGVPLSTLRKIRHRHIKNPGIKSVEPLFFYFRNREGLESRDRFKARRTGRRK